MLFGATHTRMHAADDGRSGTKCSLADLMYCSGGLEEKHKKYSENYIGKSRKGEVSLCVKTWYILVGVHRRFGGTCCLHLVAVP
jgi:hypothetical protein